MACCSPSSAHVERPGTSTSSVDLSQAPKQRSSTGSRASPPPRSTTESYSIPRHSRPSPFARRTSTTVYACRWLPPSPEHDSSLQLDISFGDPVTPGPRIIDYPQQLTTESFQILGYPLSTVIAEKLSTAVSLGELNTRDRDYGDLYRLLTLNDLDGQELTTALTATATHRGITLKPLSSTITDLGERRQTSYTAWRRRQGPAATSYPERFTDVVRQVTAFADTLLNGDAVTLTWSAATLTWS
ncbi:nucleotidyl transferase AbiEii/AbiGii toxin family protein [Streptomyces sp. NBC_00388]